jgi:hypothetical protein
MGYVKALDGIVVQYPYTIAHLRADYPNTSFPRNASNELLAEYGVYPVTTVARPTATLTQDPVEQTPELIDGVWTQVWAMVNVSPEEATRRAIAAQEDADAEAVKADAFVKSFISMTPAQVANYIENNTSNLAQVRALLAKMALMLLALARREYR